MLKVGFLSAFILNLSYIFFLLLALRITGKNNKVLIDKMNPILKFLNTKGIPNALKKIWGFFCNGCDKFCFLGRLCGWNVTVPLGPFYLA